MKKTDYFIIYVIDYFEKTHAGDHMNLQKDDPLLTLVVTELINEDLEGLVTEFNKEHPKRTVSLEEVQKAEVYDLLVAEIKHLYELPEEETNESITDDTRKLLQTISLNTEFEHKKMKMLAKRHMSNN